MADRLNVDPKMITRMEDDLIEKITSSFEGAQMDSSIHGVFSLDDLEKKTETDLCQKPAVGVGYAGCELVNAELTAKSPSNVGSLTAARVVDFRFLVILGVPTDGDCQERYSATTLLTILRRGIHGSTVSDDHTNRTWGFVRERPDPAASTTTMLYYLQEWRVSIPLVGQA